LQEEKPPNARSIKQKNRERVVMGNPNVSTRRKHIAFTGDSL
jgi:hypothetical protein